MDSIPFNEFPESQLASLTAKPNLGLAFSGGGNRAAVCALGQLRGLKAIGALSKVRYISAVSGGSWFAVPYSFVADEKTFLGTYVPPGNLHWNLLKDAAAPGSFAKCATQARMPILNILNTRHLRGDENFAYFLNRIYLKPFRGVASRELGDEHRFFCYDTDTLKQILKNNPSLKKSDFNISPPGRPYLIANGTIVRPWRFFNRARRFVPFEMTPNYSGSGPYRAGSRILDLSIGGGYVESFGYDSKLRGKTAIAGRQSGLRGWRATAHLPGRWGLNAFASPRFSLSDVIACSGSAPSVVLPELSYVVGFPQFQHWSPHDMPQSRSAELIHTDGGGLDNSGVIPLLRRNVKTIVAFVNAQVSFDNGQPTFPGYVAALFGAGKPAHLNEVLPPDGLPSLEQDFQTAWRRGEPLIFSRPYRTRENKNYGIKGGQTVRIVWVFLGPNGSFACGQSATASARGSSNSWFNRLAPDSCSEIAKNHSEEFEHFPYYHTFFENFPHFINLSALQVNALSQFTAYQIVENKNLFASLGAKE